MAVRDQPTRIVSIDRTNPSSCTPGHQCGRHAAGHVHGPGCGHDEVQHGDHVCHVVDGHLHRPHGGHCDDHGPVPSRG